MAPSDDPLVITADPQLLDQVHSCAAVVGVRPVVEDGTHDLGRRWANSPVVLIGVDRAQQVVEQLPGRRDGVVLLGHEDQSAALCRWSQPLGASILPLPAGIGWLTALLGEEPERPGGGRLLALVGGSGGLGTSTLAVGLAQRLHGARGGADRDGPVAVVDADPGSGGLDLVLGVESIPGRRWAHFAGAHGRLPGLLAELPGRDRVKVLAADTRSPEPQAPAIAAVLRAAAEETAATVVDLGRGGSAVTDTVVRQVRELWLVVGNDITSIAAARRTRHRLAGGAEAKLVVRRHRWGELSGEQVAELIGLPLLGCLPSDRRIASGVDQGMGPTAVAGRRWLRAVDGFVARWWEAA